MAVRDEATSPDRYREREKRLDPNLKDTSNSPKNSNSRLKEDADRYKDQSNYGDDYKTDLDTQFPLDPSNP